MPAAAVDDAAKGGKQFRDAMNFVEDHEAIFEVIEEPDGVCEFGAVGSGFKVEVDRWRVCRDHVGERGRANLPRADECHGWLPGQRTGDGG